MVLLVKHSCKIIYKVNYTISDLTYHKSWLNLTYTYITAENMTNLSSDNKFSEQLLSKINLNHLTMQDGYASSIKEL